MSKVQIQEQGRAGDAGSIARWRLHTPDGGVVLLALALALTSGCGESTGGAGEHDASNVADSAAGGAGGQGGRAAGGAGNSGDGGAPNGGAGGAGGDLDAALSPALPVELGTAGTYVILAKSGISTVPTSVVTGNLGVSPAAASYITGFSLSMDATNGFATSPQVTGRVYAADNASPTPSNLTAAVMDMELAFTDAAGRAAGVTELGAGNIGGMTVTPGVYKWETGLLIPTDVTLQGDATAVWIFQIAQTLTVSNGVRVQLSGGALSRNVFWQVSGQAELGTTAHFEGILMTHTSITLGTGASINGRLLAQTAVNIDSSTLVPPAL